MTKHDEQLRDYLQEEENILKLIEKLDLTEEDVESAALEQPTLYLRAARFRVQKMRKSASAKINYTQEKSRAKIRVREKSKRGGRAKAPEGAISDKAALDKIVKKAELRMEGAARLEEFSKHLMTALQQRLSVIKIIIEARWAELGTAVKKHKEEEGKRRTKKLAREVRDRYRRSRDEEDEDDS